MNSAQLTQQELEAIAVAELGAIEWSGPGKGYLTCPGEASHNHKSGRRDCMVTLLPGIVKGKLVEAPTITCFHTSCVDAVAAANKKLRSAIGRAKVQKGAGEAGNRKPGPSQRSAPNTSTQPNRTARTDKLTFERPAGVSNPVSRTIRTVVFALRERVREESLNKGEGSAQRSERSGAPEPAQPAPQASAPPGKALRRVQDLERDPRAPLAWISRHGATFIARETVVENEIQIQIGRQIGPRDFKTP